MYIDREQVYDLANKLLVQLGFDAGSVSVESHPEHPYISYTVAFESKKSEKKVSIPETVPKTRAAYRSYLARTLGRG